MITLENALAYIVLMAISFCVGCFSSYFAKKGNNLADKEDIAAITKKVEEIRIQYTTLVEEFKARHQLRMASIDRRLQTHQEAYTHWRELGWSRSDEERDEAANKCQNWLVNNCVYLEPKVRSAFIQAYVQLPLYFSLMKNLPSDPDKIKEVFACFDKYNAFPDILFDAIQLPAMCELDEKELKLTLPITP